MADYSKSKGRNGKSTLKHKLNGSSFTPLRHDLINSEEFAQLTLAAKAIFFCFLGKYKGNNNGDLELPQTTGQAKQIGMSDKTLKNGLKELVEAEFLEITRQGGRNQCSLYALTCFPINETSKQRLELKAKPTSDKWRKPKPPD